MKRYLLPLLLVFVWSLSACSLAGDITPPPDYRPPAPEPTLGFTPEPPSPTPQAESGDVQETPAITAAASLPFTPTEVISPALTTGLITGQVINSSGGELPAGLVVTLHGFEDMQMVYSNTTTVQSAGFFTLTQVEMPAGWAFLASTQYKGTTYSSDVSLAEPGATSISLNIPVYDTTTTTGSLSVDRMHIFLDFSNPGTVQVVELFIISNLGDETIVASQPGGAVLQFALPVGAANLQFDSGALGQRYVEIPGGFGDTLPVQPGRGEYQVLFSYDLPYTNKLTLEHPLNYPVNALVVLLPEDGVRIKGDALQDGGTRDVQGVPYHMYNGSGMEAGGIFSLSMSGNPGTKQSFFAMPESRFSLIAGLGVLGLALVVTGLVLYRRTRLAGRPAQEQPAAATSRAVETDSEHLLEAIVALDDLFQAGKLPEEAYRQRRAQLKQQLRSAFDNRQT